MAQNNIFEKIFKIIVGCKSEPDATRITAKIVSSPDKNSAIKAMSGEGLPKEIKKTIGRLL